MRTVRSFVFRIPVEVLLVLFRVLLLFCIEEINQYTRRRRRRKPGRAVDGGTDLTRWWRCWNNIVYFHRFQGNFNMAACSSSSSSLGIMRCRRGGLSYLKADHKQQKPTTEMRFGCRRGGRSFFHIHRPPLLPVAPNYNKIVRKACLVSNLNNCRAVENSVVIGNAYLDSKVSSPFDDQKQLDEWMSYSVTEIVRNIGEAPLLMLVYSKEKKSVEYSSLAATTTPPTTSPPPPPTIERDIDVVVGTESWPHIRRKWEEGSPIPDGVILVEQLDHHNNNSTTSTTGGGEDDQQVIGEANYSWSNNKTTKTWGVLVQGRGTEATPACYILKTCRVWSSLGFCTHFCLVRAKCFGEIAELQLNNSWLAAAPLSH